MMKRVPSLEDRLESQKFGRTTMETSKSADDVS